MYSYKCQSAEAVNKATKILDAYLKKSSDVELVMRDVQGTVDYRIYEKFNSEDKIMQMIIWNQEAPNLCEIVVIDWKKGLEPTTPAYN